MIVSKVTFIVRQSLANKGSLIIVFVFALIMYADYRKLGNLVYTDLKWYLGDGLLIIFDSFAVASNFICKLLLDVSVTLLTHPELEKCFIFQISGTNSLLYFKQTCKLGATHVSFAGYCG